MLCFLVSFQLKWFWLASLLIWTRHRWKAWDKKETFIGFHILGKSNIEVTIILFLKKFNSFLIMKFPLKEISVEIHIWKENLFFSTNFVETFIFILRIFLQTFSLRKIFLLIFQKIFKFFFFLPKSTIRIFLRNNSFFLSFTKANCFMDGHKIGVSKLTQIHPFRPFSYLN